MSSHREAPAISKDPVADNTDTYAFVSARTTRAPSRSSPTTCRSRRRSADRTSSSSATTSCTRSTSTTTPTAGRTSPTSSSSPRRSRNPDTFLYNTGRSPSIDSPELEPPPVLLGDAGRPGGAAGAGHAAWPARRATSARPRRRTTRRWPRRRIHASPAATPCSPGSGWRGSTSTSARSSTSATCARSQNLHLASMVPPARRRQRDQRASACTRSRSRCPSSSSPSDGVDADQPDVAEGR